MDVASGWVFAGLSGLGLGLPAIVAVSVPLAALWDGVALVLGKKTGKACGERVELQLHVRRAICVYD